MSSREILHIATDEKFINSANYLYEKTFPGKNTFYIIKCSADQPLKFVTPKENFEVHMQSKDLINTILKKTVDYKVIVFHGLSEDMVEVFNRSKNKEKFIWTFWGAEVYNSKLYKKDIFGAKTRLFLVLSSFAQAYSFGEKRTFNDFELLFIENAGKLSSAIFKIMDKVKSANAKVKYPEVNGTDIRDREKAINEFHFIAKLDEDISHFRKMGFLNEYCSTIPFSYYPLEFLINEPKDLVNGNNILLGNSAARTNNHVEMIDFLSKLNLDGRKIITPLSYGDQEYAAMLEKYGRKKLGNSFYPIKDFLPLEDYHSLIRSCSYVIMNHYRPQGIGNILASLYMGAKVFLNAHSFSRFLKDIGCYIYSIDEDLIPDIDTSFKPLTTAQIKHNRKKLEDEISTETMVAKLRASLKQNFAVS